MLNSSAILCIVLAMSEKKISPIFGILAALGLLLVGISLLFSLMAGAKADESDEDKGEIQLQLATMLNFAIAGSALIVAGVGFQLASGPKTARAPLPGQQGPPNPYGQQGQPQYQPPQQQQPPSGQQWGGQAPQ